MSSSATNLSYCSSRSSSSSPTIVYHDREHREYRAGTYMSCVFIVFVSKFRMSLSLPCRRKWPQHLKMRTDLLGHSNWALLFCQTTRVKASSCTPPLSPLGPRIQTFKPALFISYPLHPSKSPCQKPQLLTGRLPQDKYTSTSTRKGNTIIYNHNQGIEDPDAPSPSSYGSRVYSSSSRSSRR